MANDDGGGGGGGGVNDGAGPARSDAAEQAFLQRAVSFCEREISELSRSAPRSEWLAALREMRAAYLSCVELPAERPPPREL